MSFRTFAIGAKQFVVQDPLDTIKSLAVKMSSLTPKTIVLSALSAGDEISTLFAPLSRCISASLFELNFPVHSKTISKSDQSNSEGLYVENIFIGPVPQSIKPSSTFISLGKRPWIESYFNKCTIVSIGPGAFIARTLISVLPLSIICDRIHLPILPKPFMPILIVIIYHPNFFHNFLFDCHIIQCCPVVLLY